MIGAECARLSCSFFTRIALPFIAILALSKVAHCETRAQFDPETGLFQVQYDSAPLVDAQFGFWVGDWSWLGLSTRAKTVEAGRSYSFSSTAPGEKIAIDGAVEVSEIGTATWQVRVKEDPQGPGEVFGGIVFHITPEVLQRDGFAPQAEINADRMSWSLLVDPDKPPLKISFDKPIDRLEYEGGDQTQIRAYLLGKNSTVDSADVRMSVSVPGQFVASASQRIAQRSDDWLPNDLHWNRAPVDLSFLNAQDKPAGKRGFLRAVGEDLVFEDGTKARFWGTNLTASAIFQSATPQLVCHQAKRLSKLGFNLVRIHHQDSDWVSPNIFGVQRGATRQLNTASLEKIDWWIKCLRDEGLYVWLDLHVGRKVTAGDDVEAFDEIADKQSQHALMKGYLFVNDSLKSRSKEFAEAYLGHINVHTGLAYKDDPAVIAVLITNENDLTLHFGNWLLPDKNVPWHTARYLDLAKSFAARTGFDPDSVWKSWELGPSKLFLADVEHAYFSDMTRFLRDLGVKVPIIPTNYWGGMSASGLAALGEGDMVDAHAYGRANEIENNPRVKEGLVSWIAGGAVANKPFSVSEWNVEPFPVFDRYQASLHVASIAGLQGWNAVLQYAYSQNPMMGTASPGNWEALSDPAMLSTLPAAALLYRAGHVSGAKNSYELDFSEDIFTGREINAHTSRAIRTLTETSKLRTRIPRMAALGWLSEQPSDPKAKRITDPDFDAIGEGVNKVCSDTGELCRDWKQGVFTVDTAKSQVASGWIGGRSIALRDVSVALTTPNASVAVQSLDDRALASSSRIMISMSAQSVPVAGRLPYRSEPIEGEVRIRAKAGLKGYLADREGKLNPFPVQAVPDGYVLRLTREIQSHWLFLQ